ncbi:unannotated protein [freshwater metagenome]|uniref:Unannotated protein n=1 Tax=freshwater metagenome TaxID=449393 RepID=A0A6J7DVF3_9ZZZZ
MATHRGDNNGQSSGVGSPPEGTPARHSTRKQVRSAVKLVAFAAVIYFFVLPLIPGFRNAATELRKVNPFLLVLGLGLELAALLSYSMLTRAALGESGSLVSTLRMYRIQMSTRALSSVVPGGTAAGSALGYRLMTLSGIPGPDAGFALGTAGLGSAVVLNLLFWLALIVSIPLRGVNPGYASAAIAGVLIMGLAVALVFGLIEGQARAERILRWIARRVRLNENRIGEAVRHIGHRLEELAADRALLARVAGWAAANWLLDAASLWVFLRAYGQSVSIDGLIIAFGIANIAAVIPITPGGLGVIEALLISALVGFGIPRATATLGVASYRLSQFFFPILLGGLLYLSLRIGPWSMGRRTALKPLREVASEMVTASESPLDFDERFAPRRPKGDVTRELERQAQLFDPEDLDDDAGHHPLH